MPAKKIIADDDEVIVKKPKKVVADDEEVVVKKSSKKAVIADDDAPAPVKKAEATSSTAPRRTAAGEGIKLASASAVTASENDAWVAPNYDDMTFEAFKNLLSDIPMSIAMAQKSAFDNQQIARDADAAKNQIEAFMDNAEGGFQYNDMLTRASTLMRERGIGENSRSIEIPPPQMEKIGTKRNAIANFAQICEAIGRPPTEVQKYFEAQTSATTSLDGSNALILKMKLDSKGVERIFDKFLSAWVTCSVCKSIDTTVEKEKNLNRLFVIRCNKCKAFRHAEMAEVAFAANTTKRSKLRNAGLL